MADIVPISFGAWEPDRAPYESSSLVEAVNVLPVAGGYGPFSALMQVSGATLPEQCYGIFSIVLPDGTALVYIATHTSIYAVVQGGLANRYTGASIPYARWYFTQFAGRTIAINPYVSPLGTPPGGGFVALGGTPPKARCVGVVGNFLVLGNLLGDGVDGDQPNRIRWSGFGNPDTWGTNVGTQADYNTMPDEGGPVIAITGRDVGTVFQRNAISRMQYVGSAGGVFSFQLAEMGRGPVSTGAVCDIGGLVFYYADDGFFVWNGASSTAIGRQRVDAWFHNRLDHNRLGDIISGYDPVNQCVLWGFPVSNVPGIQNLIAFSIADQKWTTIATTVEALASSYTLYVPLESMPVADSFGGTFDDPAYAGGSAILAGVDGTHTFGFFSGSNLAATLTTGEFQSAPGQRSFVTGVRPLIDAPGVTVAVGERNEVSADPLTWASPIGLNRQGVCPQRTNGRYLRYRTLTPGWDAWTRATGIEVEMKQAGRR